MVTLTPHATAPAKQALQHNTMKAKPTESCLAQLKMIKLSR